VSAREKVVLIPAAGFGRRVGSPPAKELLIHPVKNVALIEAAINFSYELDAIPVVISRTEKFELNQFCGELNKKRKIELLPIEKSREWPESLLLAKDFWGQKNIVLLPDTLFSPEQIVHRMFAALDESRYSFATHQVADPQNWGILDKRGEELWHCEKPTMASQNLAWGVFGFRYEGGEQILQQMLNSTFDHEWRSLGSDFRIESLDEFKDITR
jgi:choline kinase